MHLPVHVILRYEGDMEDPNVRNPKSGANYWEEWGIKEEMRGFSEHPKYAVIFVRLLLFVIIDRLNVYGYCTSPEQKNILIFYER